MIEHSSTKDAARLRSLQGRGSGAWLDAIPTSRKLTISPGLFCLAAFIRLGLPLPLSHPVKNFECGKPLDQEGYHLITCKFGGGDPVWSPSLVTQSGHPVWSPSLVTQSGHPVWSHNSMVTAWSESRILKSHYRAKKSL